MKRHQSKASHNESLAAFKNTIRGAAPDQPSVFKDSARRPVLKRTQVLWRARPLIDRSDFREATDWLRENRLVFGHALPDAYPRKITDLTTSRTWPRSDLKSELAWAGYYLRSHTAELSKFVVQSRIISQSLLEGNTAEALATLNELERWAGLSIWAIKLRLYCLQNLSGLESQKAYVAELRSALGRTTPSAFIAHHVSVRNEPNTTYSHFRESFHRKSREAEIDADILNYVESHIAPNDRMSADDIADTLRFEAVGSAVDYYEALVRSARLVIANNHTEAFAEAGAALRRLHSTQDSRAFRVLKQLDPSIGAPLPCSAAIVASLEQSLRAETVVATRPVNYDQLEILARAASINLSSLSDFPRTLASSMHAACAQSCDASEVARLRKIALNLGGLEWADALKGLLDAEDGPTWPPDTTQMSLALTATSSIHPLRLLYCGTAAERLAMLSMLRESLQSEPLLGFASALVNGATPSLGASGDVAALCSGLYSLSVSDHEGALTCGRRLMDSHSPYLRRYGVRLISQALVLRRDLLGFLTHSCDALIRQPLLKTSIPLPDILATLTTGDRQSLAESICLPICYELAQQLYGDNREAEKIVACERFLAANRLSRPQDLFALRSRIPTARIIYFLENVCVESLLERSTLLDSSQEVVSERIEICSLLAKLDSDRAHVHSDEMRNLVRRVALQRHREEIEQSRVYLDTDRVRAAAINAIAEDYRRYVDLKSQGLIDFVADVRAAVARFRQGDRDSFFQLALPDNEGSALLWSIVRAIRKEFLFSTSCGLDTYLSTRVRHGSLAGEVRGPLERATLVTQRDKATGRYRPNTAWLESLTDRPPVYNRANDALNKFSLSIDTLISTVVNDWVQVRRPERQSGMLLIELTSPAVAWLASDVHDGATVEQFTDTVIKLLLQQLQFSLTQLREKLATTVTPQVLEHLAELRSALESELPPSDLPAFINAVASARTDLQLALKRVEAWFRVSDSHSVEPFSIQEPIELAITSLKMKGGQFDVDVVIEPTEQAPIHGDFASLFDIFFILLENVVRHSERVTPTARVNVVRSDGVVCVNTRNEVGDTVDATDVQVRLDVIRRAIDSGQYLHSVQTEGGSGLCKVAKIIHMDLEQADTLKFALSAERIFEVSLAIPFLDVAEASAETTHGPITG